ncbi:MAG: putative membrane protein [Candidatus Omnitrophota bacterium]|jgi:uncharacterized membrane protein
MKIIRSNDPILFFSKKEKEIIEAAIRQTETRTSGEIRVHLERKAGEDIMKHAQEKFEKLGMTQTDAHNGVLIFLGVHSKRFAILGDEGINSKVPNGFWDGIAQDMIKEFKEDRFAEGLSQAIQTIGSRLAEYFPYQKEDVNELPDEISYSL